MSAELEFRNLWKLMRSLSILRDPNEGRSGVTQLQHALQTAQAARDDGADDNAVAMALLHDVGKALSVANHPAIGAAILHDRLPMAHTEVIRTHGVFQADIVHGTRNSDEFIGYPWYPLALQLAKWDGTAFKPRQSVAPLVCYLDLVRNLYDLPASL